MELMKIMLFTSFSHSPTLLGGLWSKSILLSLLLAACVVPALANNATDVSKLLRSEQYSEAMAKHRRDAQMRFYKGVILAEQNKTAEAIAIFTKIIEDFPDLPEPCNSPSLTTIWPCSTPPAANTKRPAPRSIWRWTPVLLRPLPWPIAATSTRAWPARPMKKPCS